MSKEHSPVLYTPQEVAVKLGVSEYLIRALINAADLWPVLAPRRSRFGPRRTLQIWSSELDRFLESHTVGGAR